jgi:hypothetical protein
VQRRKFLLPCIGSSNRIACGGAFDFFSVSSVCLWCVPLCAMVVYVSAMVALLLQGWGWIENGITIVSDGGAMVARVELGARARCDTLGEP